MPRSYYERSEYSPPPRSHRGGTTREYEDVEISERRRSRGAPDFLRDDYGRSSNAGQLVVRDEEEVIEKRSKDHGPRRRPRGSDFYEEEELRIKERDRDRPRRSEVFEEDIRIKERERDRRRSEVFEEDIHIKERDRNRPRRSDFVEEEEVRIKERDRRGPPIEREREIREEEVVFRPHRELPPERRRVDEEWVYAKPRERSPPVVARETEEWTFAPRPLPQEKSEEVITIKQREREREKPREREYHEEEIRIRERSRDRGHRSDFREDVDIRERDRPRGDFQEISIREREREREPEPRSRGDFKEITIRQGERERPRNDYREENISIRERERDRGGLRNDYREEDISIRERERDRGGFRGDYHEDDIRIRERSRDTRRGDYRDEDISIRERDRRGYDDDLLSLRGDRRGGGDTRELSITTRDRSRDPPRSEYRDEEIRIRERERDGLRQGSNYRDEEIDIRERERDRYGGGRESRDETISIRERSRGPPARPRSEHGGYDEEIKIREREREGGRRGGDVKDRDIVIRRRSRSPSPARPPPSPVRPPPIHQEIITHHRHIDHGIEYERPPPVSAPVRAPSPPSPPRSTYDEIEIRRREGRNGGQDETIAIKHHGGEPAARPAHNRQRSLSVDARTDVTSRNRGGPLGPRGWEDEADYYARRAQDRSYIGEGRHGATRDWAIVDVPPGTERVRMDGAGGGSQEITWQRYNGVRRSRFDPDGTEDRRSVVGGGEMERRKYVGVRPKTDNMWTEITKDLVIRDAIEGCGYEFEETEYFFYIMDYMRYVSLRSFPSSHLSLTSQQEDVHRLVQISDDLRSRRRDRVRGIEWESSRPRAPLGPPPPRDEPKLLSERAWDEERERIVEKEWFDRRSPRPPAALPPPPPPPPMPPFMPRPRVVEKEKVVVVRD